MCRSLQVHREVLSSQTPKVFRDAASLPIRMQRSEGWIMMDRWSTSGPNKRSNPRRDDQSCKCWVETDRPVQCVSKLRFTVHSCSLPWIGCWNIYKSSKPTESSEMHRLYTCPSSEWTRRMTSPARSARFAETCWKLGACSRCNGGSAWGQCFSIQLHLQNSECSTSTCFSLYFLYTPIYQKESQGHPLQSWTSTCQHLQPCASSGASPRLHSC